MPYLPPDSRIERRASLALIARIDDVESLRTLSRSLLQIVIADEKELESLAADLDAFKRRSHLIAVQGGKSSARTRRKQTMETVRTLEKTMESARPWQGPRMTKATAARRYLRDNDPEWSALSPAEQQRRVNNLRRKWKRANKKRP